MTSTRHELPLWSFQNRAHGHDCTGDLVASWEADTSSMSDDFTPQEISAVDLFSKWRQRVSERYSDGLIPIYWSVHVKGGNLKTTESMPFQFEHFPGSLSEDFLTFFTWPVDTKSGDLLNWLELPVVDKLWRPNCADKGGFIQEATGWKPSILQPSLFLPALEKAIV